MRRKMMLQIFADGGDGGEGSAGGAAQNSGSSSAPVIDYDKLAQLVAGKQSVAEDSVIKGYLKQQGLSQEEMAAAIASFKAEKAKNDPAKKNAELQAKIDQYEREKTLAAKNVRTEDYDYVIFKALQKVDDKTTFEKALDTFLKENPRFVKGKGDYRVDTGTGNTGNHKPQEGNSDINSIIRHGFGR